MEKKKKTFGRKERKDTNRMDGLPMKVLHSPPNNKDTTMEETY